MATRKKQGANEEIAKEMRSLKKGGLKNRKQAIAIGLSKARRAGKDVPAPKKDTTSAATRKKAAQDTAAGRKKAAAKKKATRKAPKKAARKSPARKKR